MLGSRNLTAEEGCAAIVGMCQANPILTGRDGQPVDVRAACAALAGGTGRVTPASAAAGRSWRTFISLVRRPDIDMWLAGAFRSG
jgi:acyl-homoserine-lactone acylase